MTRAVARWNCRVTMMAALLLGIALPMGVLAAQAGRIEGHVVRAAGGPGLPDLTVVLDVDLAAHTTDASGSFFFDGVSPGRHELVARDKGQERARATVEVREGETVLAELLLDHRGADESVVVVAASLSPERLLDAPVTVTALTREEIDRVAVTGQVALLLAAVPGIEVTQGGAFDFNLNLRGLNSSANRRIAVSVDGRDPSVPFLGSQEWGSFSYPFEDFAAVEFVHGPASSLYGANAFNGVLSIRTFAPSESPGGFIKVGLGNLESRRIDLRWAGEISGGWWVKVLGGGYRDDGFSRDRNVSVEYPGLALEKVPLRKDQGDLAYGTLRLDKIFEAGSILTIEAGRADVRGMIEVVGTGRIEQTDTSRPWARVNFEAGAWDAQATWNSRKADRQLLPASGAELYEDSDVFSVSLHGRHSFWGDRLRAFGAASFTRELIDTAGPTGRQTALGEAIDVHRSSVSAKADVDLSDRITLSAAAGWQTSSVHDDQFTPQVSVLYKISPSSSARVSWRRGFQSPNASERGLWVPVGPPANLSAIEQQLAPWLEGRSLGFGAVPRVASGNSSLGVEKIESWEAGFSGAVGPRVFLTADYYRSEIENFVTDRLPQISASGKLNPNWGTYVPPFDLPPEALAILARLAPPQLTNSLDGSPALVVLSFTNFGKVRTQGAELGAKIALTDHFSAKVQGSWLDFDVVEKLGADKLLANAPTEQWGGGLAWHDGRFDASVSWRHVPEFEWAAGVYSGTVPRYDVVDVSASCELSGNWRTGLAVTNAFDDAHYEFFGGEVLRRHILGWLGYHW